MADNSKMEKVVSLCKRRGFIFQGSEIYGGLAGIFDYGPMGVELRHNIKQYFWQKFIVEREDVYGMGAAILMPEKVWQASGHTELFTDPLVECKICHERVRADQPEAISDHEKTHKKEKVEWTEPVKFNMLVGTKLGAAEKTANQVYLRGEITQGVHVNFKNILDSMHTKIPFGIGQIGKAFRNEITPRDFLFRQREFEQMELQYYIKPNEEEGMKQYEYWKQFAFDWYLGLGFKKENLRLRQHAADERAHYAKDAWDIEYNMPSVGWKEAWGIHHRADWDLRRHTEYSGVDMSYYDEETKERFIPWDVECSGGVDRAFLFVMLEAYTEDELGGEVRGYLKLTPKLAPVKVAVFPLLKNKPQLVEKAREVYQKLKKEFGAVEFDDNGNIGKRYRRQDEIGTPFCVTIDFDTIEKSTGVTVRDRDSGKQERVSEKDLVEYIKEKVL
ncbi:MAG: glycine--tRNA ligase [Candidatus Zambryskibacteria bacterium RIFCSPLOWO2_01_FULL_39_39]|uniref:Glycine--tRNA ligase n=1 Tax=Candidatus Zambryskibacteria bacterium RIFCSPLOWO2_01_FULL_39_39 TaxID=1802758 RepID=A0A1G2TWB6_9BACT|nr:MAG: Glycine-tRNA ligase [Parcubacteria group bacterium GW2011_GWA1_38_7]OHA86900.1 MAG: glycine--tRNA ligase [Candidatus Zambryskibacteria bacterium RIFCSPHIGHO2_01_FULL_39_63]OHA94465.1 MAG: glycine--tRNA ligase [Candidatus Zambryskibacteria bacterium RIFCSPHIGHO2_02_FULL_39_19]OHA98996.1 MAG: glycine--tRNA ligase [Candidatus Zambryskibacteria bacterium RIFCSPHIGHO2_12_FULL_39_21]OHB01581.1 MAG: glycine--tRNA ligase [Candidatus Zambryskibacteria bacterium RIFCSPLOWO2_01_FULL_39_39]